MPVTSGSRCFTTTVWSSAPRTAISAQAIGAEGQSEQWSALITLNKYKKNLDKGYKLGFASNVTPFAGFIYPIYGLLTSNADNPDMAKAFLCWLFTEEGWFGNGELKINDGSLYNGMTGRFGDYSGNTNLKVTDGDKDGQGMEIDLGRRRSDLLLRAPRGC